MKNYFRLTLLALAVFVLPGCGLASAMEIACVIMPDGDHCYQAAAVQGANDDKCAKIKGEGFKGSNPPRDKCYLQVAQNTGNYDVCKKIQGGPMSYTQEECVTGIAVGKEDPAGCKKLSGADLQGCKDQVGSIITTDRLKTLNEEVEAAKSEAGRDSDDADAQKRLKDLLAKQAGFFEFAPESVKNQFFKESREEIMGEVHDEDVKSEIARQFVDFRSSHPGLSLNDQLAKMEEIRDRQETAKRLDEQANQIMDDLKETAGDFASQSLEDLYGDDIEGYKKAIEEKSREFLINKGGENMKRGIENLEYLKGKYDKASEQYEAVNKQIERLKKVYDEVNAVYQKVNQVNKLVAEGKVDVKRAKVLHGAIFLGKGLEYATEYVPVFGSTASTITKEMMDATIRLAAKRAERSNALDKCFDDPLNCDTDAITAY